MIRRSRFAGRRTFAYMESEVRIDMPGSNRSVQVAPREWTPAEKWAERSPFLRGLQRAQAVMSESGGRRGCHVCRGR